MTPVYHRPSTLSNPVLHLHALALPRPLPPRTLHSLAIPPPHPRAPCGSARYAPSLPRPRCSSRHLALLAHLRTLQDSPYTYAGDQAEVNLTEGNQTGVKDEPAKDTSFVALTIMHADGSAIMHQAAVSGRRARSPCSTSCCTNRCWLERCLWTATPSSRCVLSRLRPGGVVFSSTWRRRSGMCLLTVGNLAASQIGAQVVRDASRRGIFPRPIAKFGESWEYN